MSGTELIMGMGEVINYLKQLEAENKKLKEQNECLQRQIESVCKANDKLKYDLYELNDIAAERGSHNEALEEERVRLQLQNEQLQEDMSAMKEELAEKFYKHYEDMGYNKLNIARTIGPNLGRMIEHLIKQNKELKEDIKELKEEFIDESESEEEEKTKYDGDDWAYGYGFTVKDGEYRICMAGGGDHWEDYVMNKNGCFIHNKDGKKKVRTFISCPEGNYIKVYYYESVLEGDIKLDEGETDMYEMVKECYEEEIMNYVKEEDHIPTDSDEEEEKCEEYILNQIIVNDEGKYEVKEVGKLP